MKHTVTYQYNGQTKQKQLDSFEALLKFATFIKDQDSRTFHLPEDIVAARQLLIDFGGSNFPQSISDLVIK